MNKNDVGIKIYENDKNEIKLEVKLDGETIWLTQKQIAFLYGVKVPTISKHISNIFEEGELEADRTVSILEIVQIEGERKVSRPVEHYNLDMIIAVGYRVNSRRATAFRIWATTVLRDHLVQGYTLNQKRLRSTQQNLTKLQKQIEILSRVQANEKIGTNEAQGLIRLNLSKKMLWLLLL